MRGFEVSFATADLHDQHEGKTQVAAILWRSYGGKARFCGPVSTLKCFEDNSLVRPALEEYGAGRVLVIDGGGSVRCALVGDKLAKLAIENDWAGIVVHGCVRDSSNHSARRRTLVPIAAWNGGGGQFTYIVDQGRNARGPTCYFPDPPGNRCAQTGFQGPCGNPNRRRNHLDIA